MSKDDCNKMTIVSQVWKKCSNCKKDLLLSKPYYVCSVSTCRHSRRGLQFCSVSCWSAHVPIMRHKEAWAEEKVAPSQHEAQVSERLIRPQASASVPNSVHKVLPQETLIVVSKLKTFIKELSDYNTSADVIDWLSEHVRKLCIQASKRAQADGRKTVMARDFSD